MKILQDLTHFLKTEYPSKDERVAVYVATSQLLLKSLNVNNLLFHLIGNSYAKDHRKLKYNFD